MKVTTKKQQTCCSDLLAHPDDLPDMLRRHVLLLCFLIPKLSLVAISLRVQLLPLPSLQKWCIFWTKLSMCLPCVKWRTTLKASSWTAKLFKFEYGRSATRGRDLRLNHNQSGAPLRIAAAYFGVTIRITGAEDLKIVTLLSRKAWGSFCSAGLLSTGGPVMDAPEGPATDCAPSADWWARAPCGVGCIMLAEPRFAIRTFLDSAVQARI